MACFVLAVSVVGCGGSEPGWQDEFREQTRRDINDPEMLDPADLLLPCSVLDQDGGRDLLEQELFAEIANDEDEEEYEGSGRPLSEILADYGLVEDVNTLNEAAQVFLDEIERACP